MFSIYVTIAPLIFSGMLYFIFYNSNILEVLNKPIDNYKNFIDGKRILGNNKTWKGSVIYIVLNIFFTIIWGVLCNVLKINCYNCFYINHNNVFLYNIEIGLFMGSAYIIFELPNSFFKRRLDITPGKLPTGIKKYFFLILDHMDSEIGCLIVISVFYKVNLSFCIVFLCIGCMTHIILNIIEYSLNLRKNIF